MPAVFHVVNDDDNRDGDGHHVNVDDHHVNGDDGHHDEHPPLDMNNKSHHEDSTGDGTSTSETITNNTDEEQSSSMKTNTTPASVDGAVDQNMSRTSALNTVNFVNDNTSPINTDGGDGSQSGSISTDPSSSLLLQMLPPTRDAITRMDSSQALVPQRKRSSAATEELANLTINKLRFDSLGLYGREVEISTLKSCLERITRTSSNSDADATAAAKTTKNSNGRGGNNNDLILLQGDLRPNAIPMGKEESLFQYGKQMHCWRPLIQAGE